MFRIWFLLLCLFAISFCQAQPLPESKQLQALLGVPKQGLKAEVAHFYQSLITAHSPAKAIQVFEEVLATSPTQENASSILCFWLSDAYRHEVAKNKNYIQHIEVVFAKVLKGLNNPCEKMEIYSLLANLYAYETVKAFSKAKEYYEKAIAIGLRYKCDGQIIAMQYFEIGLTIYERLGNYPLALQYKLKGIRVGDSLQISSAQKVNMHDQLARLYYKTQNYPQAYTIWRKALAYQEKEKRQTRQIIHLYNNLGLAKRQRAVFDTAQYWFQKAIQEAKSQRDTVWIAIASGNLGITYLLQKEYLKAIPLLEYDVQTCLRYKEFGNAVGSLTRLGDAYMALKDYQKALAYYERSLQYIIQERTWIVKYQPQLDLKLRMEVYQGLANVYAHFGNHEKAYNFLRMNQADKDTLLSLQNKENLAVMQASYDFDILQHRQENALQQQRWFIFVLILALLSVLGLGFFLYRSYQFKIIKKRLEAEKLALEHQAEVERNMYLHEAMTVKERELTIAVLQMHNKNEMLLELKQELAQSEEPTKKMEKMIAYTIDLDADWEDFKQHFEQIHPRFFQTLQARFEKITPNDLRHCAYIRMNLETKQIAHLLRITPDSLKIARSRLRKKLDLPHEANLLQFLTTL